MQKLAAEVRLARRLSPHRSNSFRAFGDAGSGSTTEIDTKLVTCAEYQLFLDHSRLAGHFHQPDHWKTYFHPLADASKPILGIRAIDAQAFCYWLNERKGKEWRYRLPTQLEMSKVTEFDCPLAVWINVNGNPELRMSSDIMKSPDSTISDSTFKINNLLRLVPSDSLKDVVLRQVLLDGSRIASLTRIFMEYQQKFYEILGKNRVLFRVVEEGERIPYRRLSVYLSGVLCSSFDALFTRDLEHACRFNAIGKMEIPPFEILIQTIVLLQKQAENKEHGSEKAFLINALGQLHQAVLSKQWSKIEAHLKQINEKALLAEEALLLLFAHDFLSILKAQHINSFLDWRKANRIFACHYLKEVRGKLEFSQFGFTPFSNLNRWWLERIARYFIYDKHPSSLKADLENSLVWLKIVSSREAGGLPASEGLLLARDRL